MLANQGGGAGFFRLEILANAVNLPISAILDLAQMRVQRLAFGGGRRSLLLKARLRSVELHFYGVPTNAHFFQLPLQAAHLRGKFAGSLLADGQRRFGNL